MSHPELSILIPAAGASKRLGQAKQLVKYQAGTLIQNAVNAALSLAPHEIIVVTGAATQEVKDAVGDALDFPSIRWIHNPHWSTGMGGSIATGAGIVNPESRGLMILLCDQWRLRAADLQKLAKTWQAAPERIVVAEAGGRYMPPVIFPSACFKPLQELDGEQGARHLFKLYPELITSVTLENAAFDLDTQAHLDELTPPP